MAACTLTTFIVLAFAGIALAAPAAVAAQPAWKIQKSPNATVSNGQIESVSCLSAKACTAVGTNLDTSGINVTLAERWNGKSWRRQSTPNPASDTVPAAAPDLLGVSCPTASFCEAVGGFQVSTVGLSLAERWNGRAWTKQSFPVRAGSTSAGLRQVSCTSASFCEAVGSYRNGIGENLALAAQWNGTSWRLQRIPSPPGASLANLNGISCVSSSFCEAVGASDATNRLFAERWDGTSWHRQAVPGPGGGSSVSCVSVSFCESVGSAGGEMWNGSSWSPQSIRSPAGATFANFLSVSCATATVCQAVGQYGDSSGDIFSLGATWDGVSWAGQTTPSPAASSFTTLNAVSCAAVAECEAAGDFQLKPPNLRALAESWNGTSWAIQHAFSPAGAATNSLSAVSCVSAVFCEAVGSRPDRADVSSGALAEIWNGVAWKIQRTAAPAHATNGLRMTLSAVSCVSTKFCEAVGSSSSAEGAGAEMWSGSTWSLQTVPGGFLTSVSCTSKSFCMAVGGDGHVDIWNGVAWSAEASAPGFTSLSSVSCVSRSRCEAVGFGPAGDEAEGWNGTAWTPQPTPTPAGGNSAGLSAVSCSSATACEAVGSYFNNSFLQVTLAEVWNGSAWAVQHTPNPTGSIGSSLDGISCASATACTAVGQKSISVSGATLAEVWNGTKWTLRSTPNNSFAGQNSLAGVSCGASQVCIAVGVTDDLGQVQATLIEKGD
jgi:hypothetical protein